MLAPYATTTVNNGNKCPHGLPVGACPICSGMNGGGIGHDRNTPRRPGEMTYNECMAEWIKIQASQNAKLQAKIDKLEQAQLHLKLNKLLAGLDKIVKNFDNTMQNFELISKIALSSVKIFINVVKPIFNFIIRVPQIIGKIQIFASNIIPFLSSVCEKITSVLGEVKNFIMAKISQPFKKKIKLILSLFVEEEQQESEEVEKLKSHEIKKRLKSLFKMYIKMGDNK